MAKYGKKTQAKVRKVMHERKAGKLRSGGSGKKVKSRKQAIAIALSEARREGDKAPAKKSARKTTRKPAKKTSRKPAKKSSARKSARKSSRKPAKKTARKSTKRGAKKSSGRKSTKRSPAKKRSTKRVKSK
jgi:hypothetical protein